MSQKVNIVCGACGRDHVIETDFAPDKNHTFTVLCTCGASTTAQGPVNADKPMDTFKIMNEVLSKLPPIIQEFRQSKLKGVDTGLGDALAEAGKEIALEVLQEDQELRGAIREYIIASLRNSFLGEGKAEEDGTRF